MLIFEIIKDATIKFFISLVIVMLCMSAAQIFLMLLETFNLTTNQIIAIFFGAMYSIFLLEKFKKEFN